ncbi:MAG: histidinol dehydrogenase [Thermoplasmata archaeon]|nr:histidinol dehydrogenase [Thermoplasmata archaeon]
MLRYDYSSMSADDMREVLRRGSTSMDNAVTVARPIVEAVRRGGDRALMRYARKLDGFKGGSFLVPRGALEAAMSRVPSPILASLKLSKKRIQAYHKKQLLNAFEFEDSCGVFGQKVVPLERIGIYIPGGTATYASSVLMTAVPAKVAGVEEIVMCTPARNGGIEDAVLAAAFIAGVDEIYSVGGAQGIAAMAYGTESISKVSKIVGPGGSIVSAAKMVVRSDCEIDSIAGPSEVLIIADSTAEATLVASEMVAQLEHDPAAVAVLVSSSSRLLDQTLLALKEMIGRADRKDILERSFDEGAVFLKVRTMSQAVEFSNAYAPEHLLVDTRNPRELLKSIRNAGSVFLGQSSSVAFGDYCSGPNHVLPTMGTARSRSALSVYDFLKIVPYQQLSVQGAATLAPVVTALAEAEGLPNHAIAARLRTGGMR